MKTFYISYATRFMALALFFCWILQDQDPSDLVCYCWSLDYVFVPFFYAMPKEKELHKRAKMKELVKFGNDLYSNCLKIST